MIKAIFNLQFSNRMKPLNFLKRTLGGMASLGARLSEMQTTIDDQKILTARLLIKQMLEHGPYDNIHEAEFKVFSQFGDDGIIQYLIHNVNITNCSFIEFGVENYRESNTRFLLINDNWKGLVIDGTESNIQFIQREPIYWRQDLTAVHEFVTVANINKIISGLGFAGDLGLLSIDIDGNDYWVWEAIRVVNPDIVVIEYNGVFGNRRAVVVPYDPAFNRTAAHYSNLYYGCSLRALDLLAQRKGYLFIGSNSAGNNAYFVRREKIGRIKPVSVERAFVESRFRESRDAQGRLTYFSGETRRQAIEELPVLDLEGNRIISIKEAFLD